MNEHIDGPQRSPGDAELRMALRGLRQDADPGQDLWPGIAARIAALPRQATAAPSQRAHRWLWPLATAASLLLAGVLILYWVYDQLVGIDKLKLG